MQNFLQFRSYATVLSFLLISSYVSFCQQQKERYAVVNNGDWNSGLTWSATNGGPGGAGVPDKNDDVFIKSGITVNVTSPVTDNNTRPKSLTVNGQLNLNSALTIGGGLTVNGQLNVNSALTIGDGLTVNGQLNMNSDLSIGAGSIIVNDGGVLSFNETAVISGGSNGSSGIKIVINDYATLKTANTGGFATSIVDNTILPTGSFRVSIGQYDPVYSSLANYEYNGNNPQNTGNALTGANNLTINNAAGVTLTQAATVSGNLTLTSGQLTTTSTNLLTLNDNATVTGVSNSSFVNGPIQKIGNDEFTFPVGKGIYYLPIKISAPGNVTDAFTAEYISSNTYALSAKDPSLNSVSGFEYWELNRKPGSSNVNVTLYWDVTKNLTNSSFFTTPALVTVAHYNGSTWNKFGGSGVGSANSGSVTWNNVSDFSPFTFGKAINMSVLPVHFSNVKASEKASGVQVEFTNLTESDVDYYEVERSLDGKAFIATKKLYPSKNNYGSASYSWLDATAKEGKFIYRIKAVETMGKTIFSNIVSITLGSMNSGLSVYAKGGQVAMQISNLPAGKYQLELFSAAGQLMGVESFSHAGGAISQTTSLKSAKPGIYILNISGGVRMQQKFLVQ